MRDALACGESRASVRPLGSASYRGTRSALGEPRRSVPQRGAGLRTSAHTRLSASAPSSAEISINHAAISATVFASVSSASWPSLPPSLLVTTRALALCLVEIEEELSRKFCFARS